MPDHEETLDAARTEEVRRLLADARHPEPMPEDVVARLDAVLDDLRGEVPADAPSSATPAAGAAAPATVVSLAARRRRRAAALLVAAAVVVVGGFAVPRLTGSGGSSDGSAASTASSADSAKVGNTGNQGGAAQQAAPEASGSAGSSSQSPSARVGQEDATAPPTAQQFQGPITVLVRPSHFADDVAAARRLVTAAGVAPRADSLRVQDCAPVSGRGDVVAVRYAGAVGALVFRPPTADSQVADLYICGTADPVRSITLPRH